MPKQIKKSLLDSYIPFSEIKDKADDSLLIPLIQSHLIDPLLKSLSVDNPEIPKEATDFIKNTLKNFTDIMQEKPALAPFILIILGVLVSPLIQGLMSSWSSTVTEKYAAQNLKQLVRPMLLAPAEVITAAYRDPKYNKRMMETLRKLGYTDEDIDALQLISSYLPSPVDVISFAVREVYTPEIARRFGQYEGAQEVWGQAKKDIIAAGMDFETFQKYWAAHWGLPSVEMGYEMLHRGLITSDDLTMLMAAQDIMPFWRDKLKQMSYVPYTRVDVRRMHKLGVLTREDVKKTYLELGYNDEKAEKMTEFTVKYNEDILDTEVSRAQAKADSHKELSKSDVLALYKKGFITDTDVEMFLTQIKFEPDEIALYIYHADYDKAIDEVSQITDIYHKAYVNGVWEKSTLVANFGILNLPSYYQDSLVKLWDLEKSIKIQRPTKSELLGFYKNGIIDQSTLITELRNEGYADKYIDWYIQGAAPKET